MSEYVKLLQYALRTIAKKRYSISEMREKLSTFAEKYNANLGHDDIERAVDRLIELDYLNDNKFALDYISDRIKFKPKGKMVLMQELSLKGLSKETIGASINISNIDEEDIAKTLLEKRMARWHKYPLLTQKNKAYQFLYSRGLCKDSIYKAIECCYCSGG